MECGLGAEGGEGGGVDGWGRGVEDGRFGEREEVLDVVVAQLEGGVGEGEDGGEGAVGGVGGLEGGGVETDHGGGGHGWVRGLI